MNAAAKRILAGMSAFQRDADTAGLAFRPVPDALLLAYDSLVVDEELRGCTRPLFVDGHCAKAVEEAFICLDNVVKRRAGVGSTGFELMMKALKCDGGPVLRINGNRTETDKSEQNGFAHVAGGCMMVFRNPRAHQHGVDDDPAQALAMIATADYLVRRVRQATRSRKRRA